MRLSINKLDNVMRNVGASQFSYEVFKSAYDTDTKIQELVKDFDRNVIELSDGSASDTLDPESGRDGADDVKKMAKSATDLGDKL